MKGTSTVDTSMSPLPFSGSEGDVSIQDHANGLRFGRIDDQPFVLAVVAEWYAAPGPLILSYSSVEILATKITDLPVTIRQLDRIMTA